MNNYNDTFVAAVAIVGAVLAVAASLGPWKQPYQLRSIARINDRYGMNVARCVWMFVAIVSLIAGIAILGGIRPGYAQPGGGVFLGPATRNESN